MIDFNLSREQAQVSQNTQAFAAAVLKDARAKYAALPNGPERFQSTRPILEQATALGLIKGFIPPALGGTSGSLIDACLAIEELHAVEPSVTLTILANGLGLTPLIIGGSPEQHREFLAPFLTGQGSPLASLCYSEPDGSANYFEPGGKGMQTTATLDTGTDTWTLNGEKIWATNCAGWDFKGADLQVVACRSITPSSSSAAGLATVPSDSAMLLLITRALVNQNASDAYTVVRHLETPGHTACSGPHIRFTNLRVPRSHVLAPPGTPAAQALLHATFTTSAATVGAMSVGIMRAAFDCAFSFAKTHDAGGATTLLHRQSVADILIDMKMQTEAARALTWKAAHALHSRTPGGEELAFEAKIWCSEAAVRCCAKAMKVVGVRSYGSEWPLQTYMADALVLPLFDGGNVGMRRRQVQGVFLQDGYKPWGASLGAREEVVQNTNGHEDAKKDEGGGG